MMMGWMRWRMGIHDTKEEKVKLKRGITAIWTEWHRHREHNGTTLSEPEKSESFDQSELASTLPPKIAVKLPPSPPFST